MKKFITPTYTFTPGASGVGTVDLSGITGFNVKNLVSIINQTQGVVIYATGSQTLKYTNVSGTTVTLFADTSSMSSGDILQVIYEDDSSLEVTMNNTSIEGAVVPALSTSLGATAVGNSVTRFRDGFINGLDPLDWDSEWSNQGDGFTAINGNSSGANYLLISLDPTKDGTEFKMISKKSFSFPTALNFGISTSNRLNGSELQVSLVGTDANGDVEYIDVLPDLLATSVVVASNVATITFAEDHHFAGGDRVVIFGNQDSRVNAGPVIATITGRKTITVPLTLANGTYNSGSTYVRYSDPLGGVYNGFGLTNDSTSLTSQRLTARRNGAKWSQNAITTASLTATQKNTSAFTEAFVSSNDLQLTGLQEQVFLSTRAADATSTATITRMTQNLPDESKKYKIMIRSKYFQDCTRPIARVVSASKNGSSAITVVTDVEHGLTTDSWIQVFGMRDITNFPASTTSIKVTAIVDPFTFVYASGAAVTATTTGGAVYLNNGGVTAANVQSRTITSLTRADNVLTLNLNSSQSGLLPGMWISIHGAYIGGGFPYDGAYKVLFASSSTVRVESVGPDFTELCGGAVITRSDFRIHYVNVNDYIRHTIDIAPTAGSDASRALPVVVNGSVTTSISGIPSVNVVNLPTVSIADQTIDVAVYNTRQATQAIFDYFVDGLIYVYPQMTYAGSTTFTFELGLQSNTFPFRIWVETSPNFGATWQTLYELPKLPYGENVITIPQLVREFKDIRIGMEAAMGDSWPVVIHMANGEPTNKIVQFYDYTLDLNNTGGGMVYNCSGVDTFELIVTHDSQVAPATVCLEFSDNYDNWYESAASTLVIDSSPKRVVVTNERWNFVAIKIKTAGTSIVNPVGIIKGRYA